MVKTTPASSKPSAKPASIGTSQKSLEAQRRTQMDAKGAALKYGTDVAQPILRSMWPAMSRGTFAKCLEDAFLAGAAWQRERDAGIAEKQLPYVYVGLLKVKDCGCGKMIAQAIRESRE
jgi:hypothetical protein